MDNLNKALDRVRILIKKVDEDKKPPEGYDSWEQFNNAHPRGPDGRFGSGSSDDTPPPPAPPVPTAGLWNNLQQLQIDRMQDQSADAIWRELNRDQHVAQFLRQHHMSESTFKADPYGFLSTGNGMFVAVGLSAAGRAHLNVIEAIGNKDLGALSQAAASVGNTQMQQAIQQAMHPQTHMDRNAFGQHNKPDQHADMPIQHVNRDRNDRGTAERRAADAQLQQFIAAEDKRRREAAEAARRHAHLRAGGTFNVGTHNTSGWNIGASGHIQGDGTHSDAEVHVSRTWRW